MTQDIKIGVDTGGTFTDFVIRRGRGIEIRKVPSTPGRPARAILSTIGDLTADGRPLTIVHGSTVATNALLERKGARTALITTAGFEDVIFIGRQTRKKLYSLSGEDRLFPVARSNCFGIDERTLASGSVAKAVDPSRLKEIGKKLALRNIRTAAIVLINSYANPENEKQVLEGLRSEGLFLSASTDILPEYREYERSATTLVNAYVMPVVDRYLEELEKGTGKARLSIMQSNEGFISARRARREPVRTILSGPAGGVVGAFHISRIIKKPRLISFDMGGTSTDVSLIDGKIRRTAESAIGDFPVRLPMVDIHTVGAGGGSIAFMDEGGILRVGPQSAGARPGPACYGKGALPTVTDANLVLGRLDPDHFLGGRMKLFPERSLRALEGLARKLGTTVRKTAEGIIRLANSNMERAIRVISVERGHDTRKLALFSFGGAGGMHAVELASRLRIPTVIVPKNAGVLSALGMLMADAVRDYSRSFLKRADRTAKGEIERLLRPMAAGALQDMMDEGFKRRDVKIELFVDVRYSGQSYEITVPWSARFIDAFHSSHRSLYSYVHEDRPVEVVNLRVKCTGRVKGVSLPRRRMGKASPAAALRAERDMWHQGRKYRGRVFDRERLDAGNRVTGCALIVDTESTAFVPPGYTAKVDEYLNLIIKRRVGPAPRRDR